MRCGKFFPSKNLFEQLSSGLQKLISMIFSHLFATGRESVGKESLELCEMSNVGEILSDRRNGRR